MRDLRERIATCGHEALWLARAARAQKLFWMKKSQCNCELARDRTCAPSLARGYDPYKDDYSSG
jgi:hypothetical protein